MPRKVLIITYYWPPSGGPGVQRWVKFVKYLKNFDWEPILYIPENPDYPIIDNSFQDDIPEGLEVIKRPIWEPYPLYRKFLGLKKSEKFNPGGFLKETQESKRKEKISNFIRSNLFIPDARKFWIKPSVKFLKKYLNTNPVNAIVTTGPPHSAHIIGMRLKKAINIPWIADFRDPWTKIFYYDELILTKIADKKHKRLEKKVLIEANEVITIGKTVASEFQEISNRKITVITNGYDEEDFIEPNDVLDENFSIIHTGNISKSKNQKIFWEAISELLEERQELKDALEIKLAGQIDISVRNQIKALELENYVKFLNYVPHNDVIKLLREAQVLLLKVSDTKVSKGAITGKIFEYLASRRPIIAIGDTKGDLNEIIRTTNSGKVFDFNDKQGLKAALLEYYQKYCENKLIVETKNIENFGRKHLTRKLSKVLNTI